MPDRDNLYDSPRLSHNKHFYRQGLTHGVGFGSWKQKTFLTKEIVFPDRGEIP
jgi:hypothetical protein